MYIGAYMHHYGNESAGIRSRYIYTEANASHGQKSIEEPEQLYARSAVLMDADSGRILFGKAEDLAKIMRYCIMQSPKREEFLEVTQTRTYTFSDD